VSADLVSVVIPTYNHAGYVVEAIQSVLDQTYPCVEIIVVDDGSTDNTREVLQPYIDKIRYVYQENQGLAASRNTGIRASSGRWVALLDADDLWHPEKLRIQMEYLQKHPDVGVLASKALPDLSLGWPPFDPAKHLQGDPISIDDILTSTAFGSCAVIALRSAFEEVGYFDSSLRSVEDLEMWARLSSRFRIVRLAAPLWWYRIHGNNMHMVPVPMEQYAFQAFRKCFREIPSLRGRIFFRQIVFSMGKALSATRYAAQGRRGTALHRLFLSFILWPFPYPRRFPKYSLFRTKILGKLIIPKRFLSFMRR
jgi:glycosyltransferase involved in cell wall biosynthesis